MNIRFHHTRCRKYQHLTGMFVMTGGNPYRDLLFGQPVSDMLANKTATTDDADFFDFHGDGSSSSGELFADDLGATTPRR